MSTANEKLGDKALVCFSGGQDSTTALFWAKENFKCVHAVTFWYGQKHAREIAASRAVCRRANVTKTEMEITALEEIENSALFTDKSVEEQHPLFPNLPASFVPLRNLILFSTAAALALEMGILDLVVGVNQVDYSNYPDCRNSFIMSLETVIKHALGYEYAPNKSIKIWTPLMFLSKKEIVQLAQKLPGCMEALAYTHTCYNNEFPPCMQCPACKLRAKGFQEAGVPDPLLQRGG